MENNGVQFNEEGPNLSYTPTGSRNKIPRVVEFVLNQGLAKDEKSATYIVFGIALAMLTTAVILPFVTGNGGSIESIDEIEKLSP